ncbi:hypothetical protein OIV83_000324 [Microbotryomycetes sp. JL201]|nr:hypothetical protein OIV83_000324 [Microbotryomycetes sp. JL201]
MTPVHVLPTELIDHVIDQLPPSELQHTAVRAVRAGATCILQLGKTRDDIRHTRTITVDSVWRDDPQMLVNLVRMPPLAWSVRVSIGPLWAPEHLDELLDKPSWMRTIEQCWFRFNPYVTQRSYYTFLKGAFFDSSPVILSTWSPEEAPKIRRLAFEQDLPPNHGVERSSVPAFGLRDLADALDRDQADTDPDKDGIVPPTKAPESTFDFAQPIVFHRLAWVDILGRSTIGAQLTHLVLRLPRRNTLSALTASPLSFPALVHLDISTTQVTSDPRFPALLRLHPQLSSIVLDRCTGLVGQKEPDNQPALATIQWLGKCCAGSGNARAEEVARAWYKVLKSRPRHAATVATGGGRRRRRSSVSSSSAAGPISSSIGSSGSGGGTNARPGEADAAPLVRDLIVIAPPPSLSKLGLGLFQMSDAIAHVWTREFKQGYMDSITKSTGKIHDQLTRWQNWVDSGKVLDQTRRLVGFKDAVVRSRMDLFPGLSRVDVERQVEWLQTESMTSEPDPAVANLYHLYDLVPISVVEAKRVQSRIETKWSEFNLCFVADCSGQPGTAHLSLTSVIAGSRASVPVQETFEQRQAREWAFKDREDEERARWRKSEAVHARAEDGSKCAHVCAREAWYEED